MSWLEKKLTEVGASVLEEGTRTRAEFAAGLDQKLRGLTVDGARYRALPAGAGNVQLVPAPCRLVGWSVLATGGPVRIVLRNGQSPAADFVAVLDLVQDESDNEPARGRGVSFTEGVWVEITGTGTLTGALYYVPASVD